MARAALPAVIWNWVKWSVSSGWGQKLPGPSMLHMFSGAFAKLRKRLWATSYLSVCPSACYNSASIGRLSWNVIFEGFSKICLENWAWLNSGKNNSYFTWRCRHIHDYISLKYFRQICRENQNTHFMLNHIFSENRAVCEIMWKNMVEPERPQMTI